MEFTDYYQTIDVERDADVDAIKRCYRRLARRFHPDVSDEPDAETRFKEVQEAYSVLKDPEKRKAYDRFGADSKEGQDFRAPPDWSADWTPERGTEPGVGDAGGSIDPGEFSDFFENLFGGAGRSAHAATTSTPCDRGQASGICG
jgi:curved DNA-binding protein